MVQSDTRQRLAKWVAAGGTLILGPLSGWRSEEFTAFTDHEFGGFEEIMGAEVEQFFTVQWVEDQVFIEFPDGTQTPSRSWVQSFSTKTAKILATWRGGYGDGQPAIIDNTYEKGRVITLGGFVDDSTWARIVTEACSAQGIQPLAAGHEQVQVIPRQNKSGELAGYGLINLHTESAAITLPTGGRDRLTDTIYSKEMQLKPFEVRIIETENGG